MTYHPAMRAQFGLEGAEDLILGFLFLGRTDKEWPSGRRISSIEEKTNLYLPIL